MQKIDTINLTWKFLLFFIATALIFISTDEIFAGTGTTSNSTTAGRYSDPLGQGLCGLYLRLSGNLGKAISMIAIFVVGVGLFMGKINWPLGVAVAIGILILFKSGDMLNFVLGNSTGSTSACTTV